MKPRGPFQGVWNIVRFNWPMFAVSALTTAGLAALSVSRAPRPVRRVAAAGGAGAGLLALTSLAASYWIYDRSELSTWRWLGGLRPAAPPRRVLNIHAGFDESTDALGALFPDAEIVTADFYDAARNPEPSIARARRAYPPDPRTRAASIERLPVADGWADLVVGFLAVHEIRSAVDREIFFAEVRRCCAADARVILVEHLRDPANFAAFGPGFLHFFSRRTWMAATRPAFRLAAERSITPFVRAFAFEPR